MNERVARSSTDDPEQLARLEAAGAASAHELATLLDVSRTVSSTLELEPLLRLILDQIKLVVDYTSAVVITGEGEDYHVREYRGPLPREIVLSRPVSMQTTATAAAALLRGEPWIIADVWGESEEARIYRMEMGEEYLRSTASYLRCLLLAPLRRKGEITGALVLTHQIPGYFQERDAALVQAVANQAAVAIENTRLYEQARQLAALEERQRLARDLHDSVTQSLFSGTMMVNTALVQYERGAPALASTLTRTKTILEQALAEMRALLYQLHPTALAEQGLGTALERLAAAVRVRTDTPIHVSVASERRLGLEAESAVFRIVQEALGNAVKHAQATEVCVTLTEDAGHLTVTVSDDGIGFDPRAPVAASSDGQRGGMGLRSMQARAAAAGLELRTESAPGAGTRVTVAAPLS